LDTATGLFFFAAGALAGYAALTLRPATATLGTGGSSRRTALAGALATVSLPAFAIAPEWDKDYVGVGAERNALSDYEIVAMQQAPSGKLDLNNALVTDYKKLPGMYPHAAGLIASNGPYNTVNDLFRLKGATDTDKKLFKKYKGSFIALPPGRTFYERINARQST
jgi:hypothetical protein